MPSVQANTDDALGTIKDRSLDQNSLVEEMSERPYRFDFFQAIRRIENVALDAPRIGHSSRADREPVRVHQSAEVDFAPATLNQGDVDSAGRFRLRQRFFGLWGPAGPLPLQMTEHVRDQTRHQGDATQADFIDLFHHRMAVLFYRAWSSSRGAVQRDRPDEDQFAKHLAALSGVLTRLQARSSGDTHATRDQGIRHHFTGRFAALRRNADGLQAVVSSMLRTNVEVHSFVLRKWRLQAEDHTRLTLGSSPHGRGGRLGQSLTLGRSVADRLSTIGLTIGPMSYRQFQDLLPGAPGHRDLCGLIKGYTDPGIDCRVRLVLDRRNVPRMSLGKQGTLGRSAWLHSRPPARDAGECEFQA